MATFSASWQTAVEFHAAAAISNGANAQDAIDLQGDGAYAMEIQAILTISSGSPNGDVLLEVFGSGDGGTSIDTEPLLQEVVNFTATGTKIKSLSVEGRSWVRVRVTNNTGVSVTYTGKRRALKQISA